MESTYLMPTTAEKKIPARPETWNRQRQSSKNQTWTNNVPPPNTPPYQRKEPPPLQHAHNHVTKYLTPKENQQKTTPIKTILLRMSEE